MSQVFVRPTRYCQTYQVLSDLPGTNQPTTTRYCQTYQILSDLLGTVQPTTTRYLSDPSGTARHQVLSNLPLPGISPTYQVLSDLSGTVRPTSARYCQTYSRSTCQLKEKTKSQPWTCGELTARGAPHPSHRCPCCLNDERRRCGRNGPPVGSLENLQRTVGFMR